MEHCEVIAYKCEPFVILFVLCAESVFANAFESVLFDVEQIIVGAVESFLNGLI